VRLCNFQRRIAGFFLLITPAERRYIMDIAVHHFLTSLPTIAILAVVAITLFTLSKGADILVDEAVSLSIHWGVPKLIIGATIVSLGTTLPEATVSVLAAINGNPDLALGNAVGSIIADTGLIIGIAAIIGVLPVDKNTIDRQGRVQFMAGILLTAVSLPLFSKAPGGVIHQWMGWVFLILLAAYIYISIRWSRTLSNSGEDTFQEKDRPVYVQLTKLILGVALVILSSKVLIPAVEITATRAGIPQSVIAATLVAFGTSLPELITAVTAVRKGHGELAVGNIIGADVLNVLFVVGSAAAVTTEGLRVPPDFYKLQFPAMMIILAAFRLFAKNKKDTITTREGIFLAGIYALYIVLNYTWI
jgi:cation:H+ antiporter